MPIVRISHKTITAIASLAIIYTFLKEHVYVRYLFLVCLFLLTITLVSGCSSYGTSRNGRIIPDHDLLSREMCYDSREFYRSKLALYVECFRPKLTTPKTFFVYDEHECSALKTACLSAKVKYEECREEQKSGQLIVNPFNLLLPYKGNKTGDINVK